MNIRKDCNIYYREALIHSKIKPYDNFFLFLSAAEHLET